MSHKSLEEQLTQVEHIPDDLHSILDTATVEEPKKKKKKKEKAGKKQGKAPREEAKEKKSPGSLGKAILHHWCPLCKYETREVMRVYYGSTAAFKSYIFIKELENKRSFIRSETNKTMFCPNCGVVISTQVCETEEEYNNETM
jgi:hypothetical protein